MPFEWGAMADLNGRHDNRFIPNEKRWKDDFLSFVMLRGEKYGVYQDGAGLQTLPTSEVPVDLRAGAVLTQVYIGSAKSGSTEAHGSQHYSSRQNLSQGKRAAQALQGLHE